MPENIIAANDLWLAFLTGSFTLAAGFVGVFFTQRHNERLARDARSAAERDAIRSLMTTLTRVGYEWAGMCQALLPAYMKFEQNDLFEFVDTDSGVRHRELSTDLRAIFGEARLRVGDDSLAKPIATAYELYNDAGEKAFGPVTPSRSRPQGEELFKLLLASVRHIRSFELAVKDIEDAARPLVMTSIVSPPSPRRLFGRRTRRTDRP